MGCAELKTSGIAHYNENSALSVTVFFLGKGAVEGCQNCSKELFRAEAVEFRIARWPRCARTRSSFSRSRRLPGLLNGLASHRRDKAIFLLAYRHGLRASEVGLLRVEDLDFKTLRIMIHRLKGSHSGKHPLQPDESKAVKAYLRERNGYGAEPPMVECQSWPGGSPTPSSSSSTPARRRIRRGYSSLETLAPATHR
jgi:integrase